MQIWKDVRGGMAEDSAKRGHAYVAAQCVKPITLMLSDFRFDQLLSHDSAELTHFHSTLPSHGLERLLAISSYDLIRVH